MIRHAIRINPFGVENRHVFLDHPRHRLGPPAFHRGVHRVADEQRHNHHDDDGSTSLPQHTDHLVVKLRVKPANLWGDPGSLHSGNMSSSSLLV